MAVATPEFMGTSEEVRILMASADMAIERGDIDGAVKILSNISSGQQFYLQGKEKLALIYLNLRKNDLVGCCLATLPRADDPGPWLQPNR